MKAKYSIPVLFFLLGVLFLVNRIESKAMNTGFSTEEFSEDEKAIFIKNVNLSLVYSEPERREIQCFDINERGMIAIGQDHSEKKQVCVYTSQGDFLYGYTFNCHQSFVIEWDEDDINILFDRSGALLSVDPEGQINDVKEVPSTVNNSIYRDSLQSTSRMISGITYRIRNKNKILTLFAVSYSQIVVIDDKGWEQVIYDVSPIQLKKMEIVICVGIFVLIALLTVLFIIRHYKKKPSFLS